MASLGKMLLLFVLFVGLLGFLVMAGDLQQEMQLAYAGFLLLLLGALLLIPSRRRPKPRRRQRTAAATSAGADTAESGSFDLPAPIVGEEDAAERREKKLAKGSRSTSDSNSSAQTTATERGEPGGGSDSEGAQLDDRSGENGHSAGEDIEVIPEDDEEQVHVAEEYVVDVDAESLQEADIEDFIADRQSHHDKVRKKIEERRRGQLADIRANAARMWSQQDESEDIVQVLSKKGHGLQIIDEPAQVEAGHPYGATFMRIDAARILKLRIPLDQGYIESQPLEEEEIEVEFDLGDLPPPPAPGDLELPPPPTPEELGLPPPPEK
uniref:Uncharacterized protein n=1 Tax=uncultured marine group II/III euryarchaeote KM3_109_G01 TaxID=1457850 RepID=A0A075GCG3_9EURY|nr:hypothetical protein [uncultured marine group II/III euryarchaeote KM3_109_G01]